MRLRSSFDIDPEILSCCTVKLIVQPILENAIYYGMEAMDGDGLIYGPWLPGRDRIFSLKSVTTDLACRRKRQQDC